MSLSFLPAYKSVSSCDNFKNQEAYWSCCWMQSCRDVWLLPDALSPEQDRPKPGSPVQILHHTRWVRKARGRAGTGWNARLLFHQLTSIRATSIHQKCSYDTEPQRTTTKNSVSFLWQSWQRVHSLLQGCPKTYIKRDHFFFFPLAAPRGFRDLSSLTRDGTRALSSESAES